MIEMDMNFPEFVTHSIDNSSIDETTIYKLNEVLMVCEGTFSPKFILSFIQHDKTPIELTISITRDFIESLKHNRDFGSQSDIDELNLFFRRRELNIDKLIGESE